MKNIVSEHFSRLQWIQPAENIYQYELKAGSELLARLSLESPASTEAKLELATGTYRCTSLQNPFQPELQILRSGTDERCVTITTRSGWDHSHGMIEFAHGTLCYWQIHNFPLATFSLYNSLHQPLLHYKFNHNGRFYLVIEDRMAEMKEADMLILLGWYFSPRMAQRAAQRSPLKQLPGQLSAVCV